MRVGIDLVSISRIARLLEENQKALRKILHEDEIMGRSDSIAGKVAAKEAIIKASNSLSIGDFHSIRIFTDKQGRPMAIVENEEFTNKEVEISISHDREYAIAIAVIV